MTPTTWYAHKGEQVTDQCGNVMKLKDEPNGWMRVSEVLSVPAPKVCGEWQDIYYYVGGKIVGRIDAVCDIQTGFSTGSYVTQYIPELFGERVVPIEMQKADAMAAVESEFDSWISGVRINGK